VPITIIAGPTATPAPTGTPAPVAPTPVPIPTVTVTPVIPLLPETGQSVALVSGNLLAALFVLGAGAAILVHARHKRKD
jgi:hypothetical protein